MSATHSKIQQGADSRERLIESATTLIAAGGYGGTSVDSIARHAGVVKSALYWHFGSKRGLLIEAIRTETGRWVQDAYGATFADDPQSADGNPREKLDALIERVEDVIVNGARMHRMALSLLLELGGEDDEVREAIASVFEVLDRTLGAGLVRSVPGLAERAALDLAAAFAAQVDGLMLRYMANPDDDRLQSGLRILRRMMLLAIGHELQRGNS